MGETPRRPSMADFRPFGRAPLKLSTGGVPPFYDAGDDAPPAKPAGIRTGIDAFGRPANRRNRRNPRDPRTRDVVIVRWAVLPASPHSSGRALDPHCARSAGARAPADS